MTERAYSRCARPLIAVISMLVTIAAVLGVGAGQPASAQLFEPSDPDWVLYRDRFIEDGRVIDTGNDDITHSEGQGYGMLLAVAFDDPETFEAIWSWTKNRLWVRDDLSVAWLWEEDERPPITDPNPAADGDLLIAWALVRAHRAWRIDDHARAAEDILTGFKNNLVFRIGSAPVIRAGVDGFDFDNGIVINPSYWIFPALTELYQFDNDRLWNDLHGTGMQILRNARFGQHSLVPDWIAIDTGSGRLTALPDRVDHLFRGFGYNAVRIPLYLLWDDPQAAEVIEPVHRLWQDHAESSVPIEVDVFNNRLLHRSTGHGYTAIRGFVDCAFGGEFWPVRLASLPEEDDYYSASLFMLTRVAIAETGLSCM